METRPSVGGGHIHKKQKVIEVIVEKPVIRKKYVDVEEEEIVENLIPKRVEK